MSRWSADSRWYRKARADYLRGNTTCHICGHGGADQIDHLIHASIAPDLRFDPANWRPAHGWRGCPTPTCRRKCNQERGTKLTVTHSPRSRRW